MDSMEHLGTRFTHPETMLAHELINPADYGGVVNPPVYHASTVTFRDMADMADMKRREAAMLRCDDVLWYGREGTPTAFALQNAIAALEGVHRSLVLPFGLAACTSAIAAFVKAGVVKTLLARYGVAATFYDPLVGAGIGALMRPNTRLVLVESPGSQTFEIQDIPAIADVTHRHGALVVMDNTWATPLYFKPFEHGGDVSVQAATKYIVGHSDATLGVITANREHWPVLREYCSRSARPPARMTSTWRSAACAQWRCDSSATGKAPWKSRLGWLSGPRGSGSSLRRCQATQVMRSGSGIFAALPACSASCSSPAATRPRAPSSTASNCLRWAFPGVVSKA